MILDTLHIIDKQPASVDIHKYKDGECPYIILDSRESGRILLLHSDRYGKFALDTKEIERLFIYFRCNALMTCYPKQHAILHKDLVRELNIMYLDCNKAIAQDWDWVDQTVTMTECE